MDSQSLHILTLPLKKYNNTFHKLLTFKSAPPNIKLLLYKSLVLPHIDYPITLKPDCGVVNTHKLQVIQNKCLRFIHNLHLNDRITSKSMHLTSKLDPINIRHSKLSRKKFYNMKLSYFPNDDDVNCNLLRLEQFSDYSITSPPIKSKKHSIFQILNFNISNFHNSLLFTKPSEWDEYLIPQPKYL